MVAAKKTDDLTRWLRDAAGSEIASFASNVGDDEAAVPAAIVEPWSDRQTEGQVTSRGAVVIERSPKAPE